MGNASSHCDDPDTPHYKKHPRLTEELKAGASFLQRFSRINFQYSGDLEGVWKVEDKFTNEIFSYHERQKEVLNRMGVYGTNVIKENYLIQRLKSPFIICLKYACQDQQTLVMITDLVHSRLCHYLKKEHDFTEEQMRYIVASIVLGLDYIHSKRIIHRDLRPSNIVFDSVGRVCINNFLLAREHDASINNAIDNTGTVGYMAPEVIEKQKHGYEVDYFGLGIILYEMATCEKLFQGTQEENLEKMKNLKIRKEDFPDKCSYEMLSFLKRLLRYNPRQRMGRKGAQDVMAHKWFAAFDWNSLKAGNMSSGFQIEEEEKEDTEDKRYHFDEGQLKRLSIQNLYLGYQYGFSASDRRLTQKQEEESGLV